MKYWNNTSQRRGYNGDYYSDALSLSQVRTADNLRDFIYAYPTLKWIAEIWQHGRAFP